MASDKQQLPQSNKLVEKDAVYSMYRAHCHISLNLHGKEGSSTRVQGREGRGASLCPQRDPAKLTSSCDPALALSKSK